MSDENEVVVEVGEPEAEVEQGNTEVESEVVEGVTGGEFDGEVDETDAEIEALQKRVEEMEAEAAKIEAMQSTVEKSFKKDAVHAENGPNVDSRSIYVGNVDYSTTMDELQEFFQSCGPVNRVTILQNKWTGQPKGFAYVEFQDCDAIVNAMILNETPFKGRPLKISPKRTNIHGFFGGKGGKGKGKGGKGKGGKGFYGRRYRPRRNNYYSPY